MVFGDFNLDLEEWKKESTEKLKEWHLYPSGNRRSVRDLRSRPIDYVLVCAPGNIDISDNGTGAFSPLPLEITRIGDERTYRLSTKEGYHENNEAVFSSSDLKMKKLRNSAPLDCNGHFTSEAKNTEHFEDEDVLKDVQQSKYVFDHDFVYFSISFISTV